MTPNTKKIIAIVGIIVAIAAGVSIFTAIGNTNFGTSPASTTEPTPLTNEALIEQRIQTFLTAYNSGDFDTVLECLTAKNRNALQALLNLVGAVSGKYAGVEIDLSDLFSLGIHTSSGDFMEVEIVSISITDDKNTFATTKMNLKGMGMQTIYFVMSFENNGWYISNITDKKPSEEIDNSSQTGTNVNVVDMSYVFDGGTAGIKFTIDDKTYLGVVNAKGKIIYYTEGERLYWQSLDNGCGITSTLSEDEKTIYTLINANGEATFSKSEDEIGTIIGFGDGLILVYKNTSSISTEEHSYGVLDYNGNWVRPMSAGPLLPNPQDQYTSWHEYKYYGNGIFISHNSYEGSYMIFNTNTNQAIKLDRCTIENDKFIDGVIYVKASRSMYHSEIYSPYDPNRPYDNRSYLPDYCALSADGTFTELSEFEYAYNGLLISTEGEYMRIFDKDNNTTAEYTLFPSNMITKVQFHKDYGVIILKGADSKNYFTVIDKKCNQIIEPTVCLNAYIYEDKIVYANSDSIFEMMDINGNIIISKSQGYTAIGEFTDGLAMAINNNGKHFIGIDGKPLTITLTE